MRRWNVPAASLACLLTLVVPATSAWAQGRVGGRFFPTTLAVDDPFVADELTLPSFLHLARPAGRDGAETRIGGELSKRITSVFGVSIRGELSHLEGDDSGSITGFDNADLELKYELFRSEPREMLVAAALTWEIGGTGRRAVGAEPFDVVNPALLFGKGWGDLPDSLAWLKPLAVTGAVGARIPTAGERHPNSLRWGLAIEYSLPYLESFVKDLDLPRPVDDLILVVELDGETFLDRGSGGKTSGTVNPGVIWDGEFFQVGIEAVIPLNDRTGRGVGVRAVLAFFLDRLFPRSLGRPLVGNRTLEPPR